MHPTFIIGKFLLLVRRRLNTNSAITPASSTLHNLWPTATLEIGIRQISFFFRCFPIFMQYVSQSSEREALLKLVHGSAMCCGRSVVIIILYRVPLIFTSEPRYVYRDNFPARPLWKVNPSPELGVCVMGYSHWSWAIMIILVRWSFRSDMTAV